MRKTYQMILALVMMMLGATNVMAGEIISLQEVPFCTWDGWGADAKSTGDAECPFIIGESTGLPYGDSGVNNYADLSNYSKLIVTATEGTPRLLFNRDTDNGQCSATESESHLIDNTNSGCMTWAAKYFVQDGNTWTVDLKQMTKDKGFAHLHAIKGANWANVTIASMELEKVGKAKQIGWINLINNSDMEGDDASSFFSKTDQSAPYQSTITDGIGVNGSRGIVVEATAKKADAWDNQFWFRFNETVAADAKYRVSFDYRADTPASASTQAHAEPSDYIHYEMLGNVEFSTEWKTFEKEGVVTSQQAGPNNGGGLFTSIAFNLNELADANNYYFDNIKFEVYKAGTVAEYYMDVIQMDFGFDTNVADLVKAGGKPRLLFPNDMVKVTLNGEPVDIISVEGYADGRFYIFTQESIEEGTVHVKLTNPSDAAYHLIYTNGPGGDVSNFDDDAEENQEVALVEDAYAYIFVAPSVIAADPEDGSFNLPNSIKEFKLTLDKEADCSRIEAKLNKTNLTVSPAEGYASEITLIYNGDDLTTGTYSISVSKIFCKEPIAENDYTEYKYSFSVGKVEVDPNDQPQVIIPASYFNDCAEGGVPEGFTLYADGDEPEVRQPGNSYGSGARMFAFGDGGDFTRGLYMRTWYLSYGDTDADHGLKLVGGKEYTVSYNLALWCTRNGHSDHFVKFQVLDLAGNVVFEDVSEKAAPNLGENKSAVKGSTVYNQKFKVADSGSYLMKWILCKNADGDEAGNDWYDVILANLEVSYTPNVPGLEITQKYDKVMESAKSALSANDDERHHGIAFDALDAAIKKYDAESPSYTAPSKYNAAIAALEVATTALQDHSTLVNTYDPLPVQAQDIVDANANTKFNQAELYGQLKEVAAKYVEKRIEKVVNPDTGDEYEAEVTGAKPLVDDAELQAAITELQDIVKAAKNFFTEGESKTSSDVGIKVLVDRIRQGAEGLMQLGVAESDPLIVRANNAVSDDDDLAEELKNRLKLVFYEKMKNGENLFPESVDETTEEVVTPTYNFTVFAKNPNTYAWKESAGVKEDNCPGWTVVEGSAGLTSMWNGSYPGDIDGLPKDLCITQYHQTNRIEQTITDLPAGIYTVMIDATEWSNEFEVADGDDEETIARKEANHELNRVYVKTSDTPALVEGEEEQYKADARIDYHGQYVGRYENYLTNVDVLDGVLTIGVKWNNLAQFMFDRVKILLAAPAAGFDYAQGYSEVLANVDETIAAAKVVGIQIFDLNGNAIPAAKKGLNIVKKLWSNGNVTTEKIIVD